MELCFCWWSVWGLSQSKEIPDPLPLRNASLDSYRPNLDLKRPRHSWRLTKDCSWLCSQQANEEKLELESVPINAHAPEDVPGMLT